MTNSLKTMPEEATVTEHLQSSSVEFSMSTKGIWTFTVKAYNMDAKAAEIVAEGLAAKAALYCLEQNKLAA